MQRLKRKAPSASEADLARFRAGVRAIDAAERAAAPYKTIEAMVYGPEVKYVQRTFAAEAFASIELTMMTDLQIGSKGFKQRVFQDHCNWLLAVPNRFVFLGGDLVNANTKHSVGDPHDDIGPPQEQVELCVGRLTPLRDDHRLLGYVGGNHERRTSAEFGDLGRLLARELKVPYSKGHQHHDVFFGDHNPFRVSLWHGVGSARTKGAKAQMIHRFMAQADSQLYLCGHLHDCMVVWDWRSVRRVDANGEPTLKQIKVAGAMSSSFQDYWDSYGEVAGLSPSGTMMARCVLEPDGKWELTLK